MSWCTHPHPGPLWGLKVTMQCDYPPSQQCDLVITAPAEGGSSLGTSRRGDSKWGRAQGAGSMPLRALARAVWRWCEPRLPAPQHTLHCPIILHLHKLKDRYKFKAKIINNFKTVIVEHWTPSQGSYSTALVACACGQPFYNVHGETPKWVRLNSLAPGSLLFRRGYRQFRKTKLCHYVTWFIE